MQTAPPKAAPRPKTSSDWAVNRRKRWWGYRLGALSLLPLTAGAIALYGHWKLKPYLKLFSEEIPISTLARFANGEPLSGSLEAYNQVPQIDGLRPLLRAPVYGHPAGIPALVNSAEGGVVLERLGRLVQTQDGENSAAQLRQALLLAAEQEDLSLINVLRQLPEGKVRISGPEVRRTAWVMAQALVQNRTAVHRLETQFRREQTQAPLAPRAELLAPGQTVDWFTVMLEDTTRERALLLDVYKPLQPSEKPLPVILISHGLTANRRTFSYLADYLASQGFFVVAVEHPDSNGEAHRSFLAGESEALVPPEALIDRPLDIRYVLDRLEEANGDRWLKLDQVGIMGHSLGGNTALAVAGARFDPAQLKESCNQAPASLNLSLIFAQCPLLALSQRQLQPDLRDDRIGSVLAISPVASELFSRASLRQLKPSVLMVAADQDWITPAVDEQIQPFIHMLASPPPMSLSRRPTSQALAAPSRRTSARYLALLQGGAHWTTMGGQSCLDTGPRLQSDPDDVSALAMGLVEDPAKRGEVEQRRRQESRAIARDYLCGLGTAFFKTHLDNQPLDAYLSADYAAALSQPELPLILVESLKLP